MRCFDWGLFLMEVDKKISSSGAVELAWVFGDDFEFSALLFRDFGFVAHSAEHDHIMAQFFRKEKGKV
jgi:hypothetical protein